MNNLSLRDLYTARVADRAIERQKAAREIGCNDDTLHRWLKGRESNFVDALVSAWLNRSDEPATAPTIEPAGTVEPIAPAETKTPIEAMDRLNEQNRILQGCAMLPRGKKLTDEQIQTVREAFERHIAERGVKPAQVAREVSYGDATISQWRDGTYKGSLTNITHAVNDWMERSKRRSEAERPKDYVTTWVAETMRTVAYQAHTHGMMAAIVAPAGCGKSKVLKALTDEFRAVYVYCTPKITERVLLYKIACGLGYKKDIGSVVTMEKFIIDQLAGTKRTIFLDEAQQLVRAIGIVRSIFDQAEVPIVMAGTAEILEYVDDRADGRGQFSSRCMCCNIIEAIRNVESPDGGKVGRDLFTLDEIQRFFKSKQVRLTVEGMRLMLALACLPSYGTLRLVEKLAAIAMDANRDVDVLDREHVLEALELNRGASVAAHLERLVDRQESQTAVRKTA